MVHLESKIEEISSLLDSYSENSAESIKTEILTIVRTEVSNVKKELDSVKKRLIKPDISYEQLVSQVVETMRATSIDCSISLFENVSNQLLNPQSNHDIINGEISLLTGQIIQGLSEDNLWYLANTIHPHKDDSLTDIAFLTNAIITSVKDICKEFLIENNKVDYSFDDLKAMAVQFVNNNNIAEDTIYQWLEKRLRETPELDRAAHGIVSNMMSSLLERVTPNNLEKIYTEELFKYENSHLLPEEFRVNDGSDTEEVLAETLKLYLFFTILNQEV